MQSYTKQSKKEKIYNFNEYSLPIVFLRDIYKRSVSIKVTDQNLGSRLSKIASKLNNAKKKKNL